MLRFLTNILKQSESSDGNEALIGALSQQLEQVNTDTDLMEKELDLRVSGKEWLDEWGSWFGITRLTNEDDERYRFRILTAMEDKVTIPAIRRGVRKILGDDTIIKIYEPFVEIRYYNISTFSGEGRYQDGDYYRIGVIDVIINKPITEELVRFINSLKAAGVSVKFTYKHTPPIDEVVVGDGADDMSIIYSKVVHVEVGHIDESDGQGFSDYDPEKRYSGKREIWVGTKNIVD